MMINLNPILVGKLLDRAGHPTTFDAEALVAMRKAASHCRHAGLALSDMMVVDSEIFFKLNTVPVKTYLAKIADITLQKEAAETIAEDAIARCALLEEENRQLRTHNEYLARAHEPAVEPVPAPQDLPQSLDAGDTAVAVDVESISASGSDGDARGEVQAHKWSRREKSYLATMIGLGFGKTTIARRLKRKVCDVAEMMRRRWRPDCDDYQWAT